MHNWTAPAVMTDQAKTPASVQTCPAADANMRACVLLQASLLLEAESFAGRVQGSAESWAEQMETLLTEELDGRLRAHRPRAGRIEEEVRSALLAASSGSKIDSHTRDSDLAERCRLLWQSTTLLCLAWPPVQHCCDMCSLSWLCLPDRRALGAASNWWLSAAGWTATSRRRRRPCSSSRHALTLLCWTSGRMLQSGGISCLTVHACWGLP